MKKNLLLFTLIMPLMACTASIGTHPPSTTVYSTTPAASSTTYTTTPVVKTTTRTYY